MAAILSVHLCSLKHGSGYAHAMDPRVEKPFVVMMKTAGLGVAAGAVVGFAGAVFLNNGGIRTFAKGVSLGLYGGLLLGVFVLAAPPQWIYGNDPAGDTPPPAPGGGGRWKRYDQPESRASRVQLAFRAHDEGLSVSHVGLARSALAQNEDGGIYGSVGSARWALWMPVFSTQF